MTLKDLNNKSILITNKDQLGNILRYMDINGLNYKNDTRRRLSNIIVTHPQVTMILDDLPLFLHLKDNFVSYTLNMIGMMNIGEHIKYEDLNLNWYTLIVSDHSKELLLYHSITDKTLILTGVQAGKIFSTKPLASSVSDDYTLTSTYKMKLYRNGDNLSIFFHRFLGIYNGHSKYDKVLVDITKDGFIVKDYMGHTYVAEWSGEINFDEPHDTDAIVGIDEVKFKRNVI